MHKRVYLLTSLLTLLLMSPFMRAQENLDTAIRNLADTISRSMTEQKKTKIAVIPFQDLSSDAVTTFGKYIAEELTTGLFNSGKFYIVERNLLAKVLDELKLAQTGAVDPNSAKELGKITGVDAVVTGTIQDLVNRVAVNCRIIETETGNIFAAASEKIIKDDTISQLLGQAIKTNAASEGNAQKSHGTTSGLMTYDASGYVIEDITGIHSFQRNGNIQYWGRKFNAQLISFTVSQATSLKLFLIDLSSREPLQIQQPPVRFRAPIITDDKGNEYDASKIAGKIVEVRLGMTVAEQAKKTGVYDMNIPVGGRSPITVEFPRIPDDTKTVLVSLNDKQVEVNWQDLLKRPLR